LKFASIFRDFLFVSVIQISVYYQSSVVGSFESLNCSFILKGS
jgi:hypothetical protein